MLKKTLIPTAPRALMLFQILMLIMMALTVTAQLEDNRDMDQEGSGVGSGESTGGCIPPTRADFPNILQSDVINEIKCHLACIDKVSKPLLEFTSISLAYVHNYSSLYWYIVHFMDSKVDWCY